jgi:two-component system, OmpR family, response regulator
MRVLVVEDDERTAALLARGLREARHRVDVLGTGEAACEQAGTHPYEAILLDVVLPGIDGMETCRRLRSSSIRTPVLMLTARGEIQDRVLGLDAGADDYVTKPFFLDEVLARLRAFERRPFPSSDGVVRVGTTWYDPTTASAGHGDADLHLTVRQAAVLEVFLRHPGQVLERAAIADAAWDGALDLQSNVVDVHVAALRRELARVGAPGIATVRGLGYRFPSDGL